MSAGLGTAPAAKPFRTGTERAVAPGVTWSRLRPRLAEFGITRVADVTGLDHIGLPVTMVVRPESRSLAVSQGKGLTPVAARVSGVMESIELWHAERPPLALRLASARDLAGEATVDLGRLPRRRGASLPPGAAFLWAQGEDLLAAGAPTWVPHDLVHVDSTLPPSPASRALTTTSNGLASGNTLAEATVHALSEVVERDATRLWLAGGVEGRAATRIDPASIDDPACATALARCAAAGVRPVVFDLTSDVGVACAACVLLDDDQPGAHRTSMGMGCHPRRAIAVSRAVTEAAQSRLTLIAGSRDDVFDDEYADTPRAVAERDAYRAMLAAPPGRALGDLPDLAAASFDDDVALLLDRLRAAGIEQAVRLVLSAPGEAFAVVRLVVPGLEGAVEAGTEPGRRARAAAA